jgi:hypothetical protein
MREDLQMPNLFTKVFLVASAAAGAVYGGVLRAEDAKLVQTNLGFARVAILLVLVLVMIPAVARVSAAKPPPPPSTGSSFSTAYSVPYSYSVAESISQASSGGFAVGALCSAAAATTPNCNGPATVLRVDSSGNIQSQTQYSYGNGPQSTALNILKATSDGGAIFAGQPQSGCPAQNLNSCGAIVKVDSTGKVQWANDLLFATSATPYSSPLTWPFDIQQTNDGGFILVGYAIAPGRITIRGLIN